MLNKKIGIKNVQSGAVTQPTSTSAYNMDRYEAQCTDIYLHRYKLHQLHRHTWNIIYGKEWHQIHIPWNTLIHRALDTQTDETLDTLSYMVLDTHIYIILYQIHRHMTSK